MTSSRSWALAGVLAGATGVATSYAAAKILTIRESPVVAVSEMVIGVTPGAVAERAIAVLGKADKPFLVSMVLLLLLLCFALAGWLWSRGWWKSLVVWGLLAAVGAVGVLTRRGAGLTDLVPLGIGLATWLLAMWALAATLRRAAAADSAADSSGEGRRGFLVLAGGLVAATLATTAVGRVVGNRKRAVQETRRLLRIPGVTSRDAPLRARAGLAGIAPWRTPNADFYIIDTAIAVPTITPSEWRLRIHGMVDREVVLTYDDLVRRELSEAWITLNCVSNPVGGPLIGNAWWSGIRTADLLAEAGVHPDADAVLQTSDDGWTCGTPLVALTDNRDAMLAVAMNGEPLPIEHGFPVRTIVPGLYGYVSACKWVVDIEVTRFSEIEAFWTQRGWSEEGPVKLSSRIDVPRADATVQPGTLAVGGVAWAQHVGIAGVEVALDGGPWTTCEVANPGTNDTWVQWTTSLQVEPGEHELRVRARDKHGLVQTGVQRDVVPDGATGWHTVSFTAEEQDA